MNKTADRMLGVIVAILVSVMGWATLVALICLFFRGR